MAMIIVQWQYILYEFGTESYRRTHSIGDSAGHSPLLKKVGGSYRIDRHC